MNVTFRLRRGPSEEWMTDNPTLSDGEPGLEVDTGLFKVGDGTTSWVALPYYLDQPSTTALIQAAINDAVLDGVPGPIGPAGPVGPTGPAGPKGDKGDPGNDGADGLDGSEGPIGPVGPKGDKGDPGDDETAGPIGPAGPKGDPGEDGADYTGPKITVSSIPPVDPTFGDVWIDTSE